MIEVGRRPGSQTCYRHSRTLNSGQFIHLKELTGLFTGPFFGNLLMSDPMITSHDITGHKAK